MHQIVINGLFFILNINNIDVIDIKNTNTYIISIKYAERKLFNTSTCHIRVDNAKND